MQPCCIITHAHTLAERTHTTYDADAMLLSLTCTTIICPSDSLTRTPLRTACMPHSIWNMLRIALHAAYCISIIHIQHSHGVRPNTHTHTHAVKRIECSAINVGSHTYRKRSQEKKTETKWAVFARQRRLRASPAWASETAYEKQTWILRQLRMPHMHTWHNVEYAFECAPCIR